MKNIKKQEKVVYLSIILEVSIRIDLIYFHSFCFIYSITINYKYNFLYQKEINQITISLPSYCTSHIYISLIPNCD
jgi:hypothetical protein